MILTEVSKENIFGPCLSLGMFPWIIFFSRSVSWSVCWSYFFAFLDSLEVKKCKYKYFSNVKHKYDHYLSYFVTFGPFYYGLIGLSADPTFTPAGVFSSLRVRMHA